MRGRIVTAHGAVYALPELLRWRIRRTLGVPCDSFEVVCLYGAEMAAVLDSACRFEAVEDGAAVFRGVIDEWSASLTEEGLLLTLTGRGMAALLLDNETEAANFSRVGLRELVRRYVTSCGIACEPPENAYSVGDFSVEAGASRWQAVERFAARCGLTPYFTALGVLRFFEDGEVVRGGTLPARVIAARWREKRYGVLSAVTLMRCTPPLRLENEEFIARGGKCERVLYVSREHRAEAEEKLRASEAGARELTVTLAGAVGLEPGERVTVTLAALGIAGEFSVRETVRSADALGEETEIVLWKE